MKKFRVQKSVVEQMTGKLKTLEKADERAEFAEKLQNSALYSPKKQITSKLQANKNHSNYWIIFDDEEIQKSKNHYETQPRSHGKFASRGIESIKAIIKDMAEKYSYDDKQKIKEYKERCKTKYITPKGNVIFYEGDRFEPYKKYTGEDRLRNNEELKNAITLADGGFSVYMPLEFNQDGKKKFDAIVNDVKVDFKYMRGDSIRTVESRYQEGLKQAPNISYYIPKGKKSTHKEIEETIYRGAKGSKKEKGIVILYFEDENKLYGMDLRNVGETIKKSILEKYAFKAETHRFQNCENTQLQKVNSFCKLNISQQNNLSSKKVIKSLTYSGHKLQGRTRLYGMDISIENKKGSYRSGTDKDGHKWKVLMHYDYGYIRGTVGVDKDHLDTYVGPDKKANKVYVIHQNDPVTHKYDEDKCMLCFSSAADAKAAYMKQYDRPGFYGSMTTMTIEQFKSFIFSHKGKMVHKSFDINITDITENNKQQKLEQFSKALNAIADNRPFMIKHIPVDASKNYGNLLVRITDFDRSKIEKAVHKVALSLDTDISGASKGESYVYEAQKELAEGFFKEFTDKTRAIYNFVISYFDLPDIRIVSKAGELKHKGKILYNPETGLPIKESDWKKFVVELEKYLNRNYSGIGEKIVLSSESLGIILDRLSKTNSLEAIRKMSLSSLKTKRYDVDWISESVKNMKDTFGEVISRERQARIQIACDSAAQRVTRVSDDIRNNIQQIIIDGIRDKQSKSVVAQNLFDKCASLNRDMQRIADSEVQMAANSAYIKEEVYNSKPDEKVYFKRFEMLDDNTCKKCRKLKGTIALWSEVPLPDERIKDEYAEYAIWDGKNEGDCPVGIVHPWCYSDDTEVMTNNGWKLFKDVEKNDKIMSINPETKEIDFIPFVKKVQYEYNGKMIHFPGRNFDLLVTPDHNMLYFAGNGHGEKRLKEIMAKDLIKQTAFSLPRAIGKWEKSDTNTVKFGDLTVSKVQYFRLWAWYLAEGSGRCRDGCYEVKLAQKDPMKIYNDLPEFQSVLHIGDDAIYILGEYARYFECMFGIYADKKFIPPFIKNSSVENIREFLAAFVMADGTKLINHKCSSNKAYSDVRNEQVLRTSSKKMADDLCEMIVKAGWMPSVYVVHDKGKLHHFENGNYVSNTDCYNISICHSKTRTYAPDKPGHLPRHNPVEVDYKGMVYDVELEKWHFLLVRRNGKCAWSGNCRGTWVRYYPEV